MLYDKFHIERIQNISLAFPLSLLPRTLTLSHRKRERAGKRDSGCAFGADYGAQRRLTLSGVSSEFIRIVVNRPLTAIFYCLYCTV